MLPSFDQLLVFLDATIMTYVIVFFLINVVFLAFSLRAIRTQLRREQVQPAAASSGNPFLPTITLLVPAYNEEVTIAESLRSLLRLDYPAFEIIICNDGSKDATVDVLRREFQFVRTELEYNHELHTAAIRAFYEARAALPRGCKRMMLIDKENGGKADALNACINIAQGELVTSMDADSLLEPDALLRAARVLVDDPEVVAVGAQVGISNGSLVKNGRVVEMRLPRAWISRFQIVEYMRSFAQGRVALASVNSLLILSGVFAILKRDLVVAVGGFLTPRMRSRIGLEYCGADAHTVCEDMEIIVRVHRYLLDRHLPGKVTMLPFPIAWTEAPENYEDLGKQRARWYRGLLEVLYFHRSMLFRPRFRQIGMFSLPYQLLFEAVAPLLETLGYALLIVTAALGTLSALWLLLFLSLATAINLSLSCLSVMLCIGSERATPSGIQPMSLFNYIRLRDVLVLLATGFLSNFGYRQYLVRWQLRGLSDFVKRKRSWDKFARKGFATSPGGPA